MSKLTFKSSEGLKTLASHTLKTTFFRKPYTKENTKEKGVWFVKDQGIYLMKGFDRSKEEMPIVYAKGFDPYKDKDVWDKSYIAVGGDDFAEFLELSIAQLHKLEKGHDLELEVSPTTIEVTV